MSIYFLAEEIKEATHSNQHTEAYILACECIGERADLLKRNFQSVQAIIENTGYLDAHLSNYRYSQYEAMIKLAKSEMSGDEFELMYSCL